MPLVSGAFETDDKPFRRSDKRKRHPTKLAKMVDEAIAYPPYKTSPSTTALAEYPTRPA